LIIEKALAQAKIERLYFAHVSEMNGRWHPSGPNSYVFYAKDDDVAREICSYIGHPDHTRVSILYRFADDRQLKVVDKDLPDPISWSLSAQASKKI